MTYPAPRSRIRLRFDVVVYERSLSRRKSATYLKFGVSEPFEAIAAYIINKSKKEMQRSTSCETKASDKITFCFPKICINLKIVLSFLKVRIISQALNQIFTSFYKDYKYNDRILSMLNWFLPHLRLVGKSLRDLNKSFLKRKIQTI